MAPKKTRAKTKATTANKKAAKKITPKKAKPSVKPSGKKPAKRAPKTTAKKTAKRASAARVHPIVHWEIQSQTPDKLHSFYAEALGWSVDANNPMNYGMVSSKGKGGINGGIGGANGKGSRVTVYAAVPSIETMLERIEALGGRTVMPRTDVGPVIMALYTDPEGNVMGLIEG
jgi:predicted enzyme related to lactoylglutathione lyase